jgi:excisionase family DNA binding protein
LVQRWRKDAELLRQYRNHRQAEWLEDRAAELERALEEEGDSVLSLAEAAARSGYSADHLRRLHRDGELTATRNGRRLLFRAGDLPKKSTAVDPRSSEEYDPNAHARQVAVRRSHGGTS